MLSLISHDRPKSLILGLLLVVILVALAGAPFLFPGSRSLETAARICVFIVLVASYDLMIGYSGIVSFAHTMFFGIGAYGVAIAAHKLPAGFVTTGIGALAGIVVAALLAVIIGLLSLRVRAIFFAMITLAIASAFAVLVSQLSAVTGGEDGLNYAIPHALTPAFKLIDGRFLGIRLDGKVMNYYLVFAVSLALFLFMLRIVNSPFGSVLKAIRENDFRAEAIGYRVVIYRTAVTSLSAAIAAAAGALYAVWLRYVGPDTALSMEIMIDVLLMVVIGGMGTMYGAVIGATVFVLAQNYLQALMGTVAGSLAGIPILPNLFNPDRWLLWLGLLFVLSVYFFPTGVVGRLRKNG
jgi:branched-chain amino acid transport system permease protein